MRTTYFKKYYMEKKPDSLKEDWVCEICNLYGNYRPIKTKSGKRKHLKSKKHIDNNIKNIDDN